jgi:drug/metabolite transporter (DMT)-like permease
MSNKESHGFLYGSLAALCMTIIGTLVKGIDAPVETMVFFRFLIGLVILLPWLWRSPLQFHWNRVHKFAVRALAGAGAFFCFFYSLQLLPEVNAMALSNTTPLFVPLFVFFQMKFIISKRRIGALVIGFLGVLCILRPSVGIFEQIGVFVGLLNGFLAAMAFVSLRQLTRTETARSILFHSFLIGTVVSIIPMLITWEPIEDSITWLGLISVGFVGALSQYLVTKSYTHAAATKASLTSYLTVIFGGIMGWIFFAEQPMLWDLLGAVLIILSGVIAFYDRTPPRKRNQLPVSSNMG